MKKPKNSTSDLLPSVTWRSAVRRRLLAWYGHNAREMPWRKAKPDPYHVWLSEIMLQQTQVATVRPYFERFIAALPTIQRLAAAELERVLRLWEGLGYYRRARQLHAAAQQIVREHGGSFPHDPEAVRALPGIGRYTAGAILSIAFGLREPILEANTRRLYARLLALRDDPTSTSSEQLLWQFAESLLPRREPGELNQALMELGSLICTPRQPKCDICPLQAHCPTAHAGLQEKIPLPKRKPAPTRVSAAAVAIRRRGRVLLIRREGHGRFGGLWDFPRVELTATDGPAAKRQLADQIEELCGVRPVELTHVTTIQHTVTRFRITLDCYLAEPAVGKSNGHKNGAGTTVRWVPKGELSDLPLSATGRQLAHLIHDTSPTRKRGKYQRHS
ncbi:MAG: A/G-specific adenine glycosylase [Planctomycetes bacterium]|nr:A/G-specific adenine glycosylase [Planctomycetota bacterium]